MDLSPENQSKVDALKEKLQCSDDELVKLLIENFESSQVPKKHVSGATTLTLKNRNFVNPFDSDIFSGSRSWDGHQDPSEILQRARKQGFL